LLVLDFFGLPLQAVIVELEAGPEARRIGRILGFAYSIAVPSKKVLICGQTVFPSKRV
jgi:hypothetical protein